MEPAHRITGPLKTWYDLHEAIAHEIEALATATSALDAAAIEPFAERFGWFAGELRTHSEVEDGIMFPAITHAGGRIDPTFTGEHHGEQTLVYDTGCAILEAKTRGSTDAYGRVADLVIELRDRLLPHLRLEEEQVLPQVPVHFDDEVLSPLTVTSRHPPPMRRERATRAHLSSHGRTGRPHAVSG